MWHDVPFAHQRRRIVGVLRMCWLLPGSFDCFCCPRGSVHILLQCTAILIHPCSSLFAATCPIPRGTEVPTPLFFYLSVPLGLHPSSFIPGAAIPAGAYHRQKRHRCSTEMGVSGAVGMAAGGCGKTVRGGCCRLQMPLGEAVGVKGVAEPAAHRSGGGVGKRADRDTGCGRKWTASSQGRGHPSTSHRDEAGRAVGRLHLAAHARPVIPRGRNELQGQGQGPVAGGRLQPVLMRPPPPPAICKKLAGGRGVGGGVWHVALRGEGGGGRLRGGGGLLEHRAIPSLQQVLNVKCCHGVSLGCTKGAEAPFSSACKQKFGTIGTMAPAPLSLKTRGGRGGSHTRTRPGRLPPFGPVEPGACGGAGTGQQWDEGGRRKQATDTRTTGRGMRGSEGETAETKQSNHRWPGRALAERRVSTRGRSAVQAGTWKRCGRPQGCPRWTEALELRRPALEGDANRDSKSFSARWSMRAKRLLSCSKVGLCSGTGTQQSFMICAGTWHDP